MAWNWANWLMPLPSLIPGLGDKIGGFADRLAGTNEYDPANKANPYIERAREQYLPYQQQGQAAYGPMNEKYSAMSQDPAAFIEQLMSGYKESGGYKQRKENALTGAANDAAAGGMRGTFQDINNESGIADSLLNQDMQQWLSNVLRVQGAGLEGQRHFYDTGVNATSDIANTYNQQGGLAFQNQSQQNQSFQDMIKALMDAFGKAAGAAGGI